MTARHSLFVVLAAAALAACGTSTEYVPRRPGMAAIGMKRGEIAVYKDGALTPVGDKVTLAFACSAPAAQVAGSAIAHHASYKRNTTISSVFYALGGLMPPLGIVGVVFGMQAAHQWYVFSALTVDAVNMHNDAAACSGPGMAAAPAAAPAAPGGRR